MGQSAFLTVEDVASNLKVTRQTVSKYIKDKELNAIKINKSYRISAKDFESFLSNNSIAHEPQVAYLKNNSRKAHNAHLSILISLTSSKFFTMTILVQLNV